MDTQSAAKELWYYTDAANQPVGPVPFPELQRLATNGVIRSVDYVREKGTSEWKRFDSVCPRPSPPTPAVLPASEIAAAASTWWQGFIKRFILPAPASDAPAGSAEKGAATQSQESKNTSPPPSSKKPPSSNNDALKWCGAMAGLVVAAVVVWHYWRALLCLSAFLGTWYAFGILSLRAKRSKMHAIGGGFILGLLALILTVKLFGGHKETTPVEAKQTFALTDEQFRIAFNKGQPRLQIEFFKNEKSQGEPWVTCLFTNGSGLTLRLEPGTRRIRNVMAAFTKEGPGSDSYLLAETVIFTLSPEANSTEAWDVVNRLVSEADGSDKIYEKAELLRNLSVRTVPSSKTDSDLSVVLLFSPSPVAATLPPKAESDDGSPSDEIIRKFVFFQNREEFKRGSTLISKGGYGIPTGTLLFPVRHDPDRYYGRMRFYFFRDEFGDWKCMWENDDNRGAVKILSPGRFPE